MPPKRKTAAPKKTAAKKRAAPRKAAPRRGRAATTGGEGGGQQSAQPRRVGAGRLSGKQQAAVLTATDRFNAMPWEVPKVDMPLPNSPKIYEFIKRVYIDENGIIMKPIDEEIKDMKKRPPPTKPFDLEVYQKIVALLVAYPGSTARKLLVKYDTGAGKTCIIGAILNLWKKNPATRGNKVYVVVPAATQRANFLSQFSEDCPGRFLNMLQETCGEEGLVPNPGESVAMMEKFLSAMGVEVKTFTQFGNLMDTKPRAGGKPPVSLENTLVLMDEVHTLLDPASAGSWARALTLMARGIHCIPNITMIGFTATVINKNLEEDMVNMYNIFMSPPGPECKSVTVGMPPPSKPLINVEKFKRTYIEDVWVDVKTKKPLSPEEMLKVERAAHEQFQAAMVKRKRAAYSTPEDAIKASTRIYQYWKDPSQFQAGLNEAEKLELALFDLLMSEKVKRSRMLTTNLKKLATLESYFRGFIVAYSVRNDTHRFPKVNEAMEREVVVEPGAKEFHGMGTPTSRMVTVPLPSKLAAAQAAYAKEARKDAAKARSMTNYNTIHSTHAMKGTADGPRAGNPTALRKFLDIKQDGGPSSPNGMFAHAPKLYYIYQEIMHHIKGGHGKIIVYSEQEATGANMVADMLRANGWEMFRGGCSTEYKSGNGTDEEEEEKRDGGVEATVVESKQLDIADLDRGEKPSKFTFTTYYDYMSWVDGKAGEGRLVYKCDAACKDRRLQRYNAPDNDNGDKISVLILNHKGREGINTKAVRKIIFVEAPLTMNAYEQVRGRAARFLSHIRLPEDKRYVDMVIFQSDRSPNSKAISDFNAVMALADGAAKASDSPSSTSAAYTDARAKVNAHNMLTKPFESVAKDVGGVKAALKRIEASKAAGKKTDAAKEGVLKAFLEVAAKESLPVKKGGKSVDFASALKEIRAAYDRHDVERKTAEVVAAVSSMSRDEAKAKVKSDMVVPLTDKDLFRIALEKNSLPQSMNAFMEEVSMSCQVMNPRLGVTCLRRRIYDAYYKKELPDLDPALVPKEDEFEPLVDPKAEADDENAEPMKRTGKALLLFDDGFTNATKAKAGLRRMYGRMQEHYAGPTGYLKKAFGSFTRVMESEEDRLNRERLRGMLDTLVHFEHVMIGKMSTLIDDIYRAELNVNARYLDSTEFLRSAYNLMLSRRYPQVEGFSVDTEGDAKKFFAQVDPTGKIEGPMYALYREELVRRNANKMKIGLRDDANRNEVEFVHYKDYIKTNANGRDVTLMQVAYGQVKNEFVGVVADAPSVDVSDVFDERRGGSASSSSSGREEGGRVGMAAVLGDTMERNGYAELSQLEDDLYTFYEPGTGKRVEMMEISNATDRMVFDLHSLGDSSPWVNEMRKKCRYTTFRYFGDMWSSKSDDFSHKQRHDYAVHGYHCYNTLLSIDTRARFVVTFAMVMVTVFKDMHSLRSGSAMTRVRFLRVPAYGDMQVTRQNPIWSFDTPKDADEEVEGANGKSAKIEKKYAVLKPASKEYIQWNLLPKIPEGSTVWQCV